MGAQAVILKSENYHFHRLDLTRQAGFIVTIYDEDGLRLAATPPLATPAEALSEARKIIDKHRGTEKIKGATHEQAMADFKARATAASHTPTNELNDARRNPSVSLRCPR